MIVSNEDCLLCEAIVPDLQGAVVSAGREMAVLVRVAVEIADRLRVSVVDVPRVAVRRPSVVGADAAVHKSYELVALMVLRPLARRVLRRILRVDFGYRARLRLRALEQQDLVVHDGRKQIRVGLVELGRPDNVAEALRVDQFGRFEIENVGIIVEIGQPMQGRLHHHLRAFDGAEAGQENLRIVRATIELPNLAGRVWEHFLLEHRL